MVVHNIQFVNDIFPTVCILTKYWYAAVSKKIQHVKTRQ